MNKIKFVIAIIPVLILAMASFSGCEKADTTDNPPIIVDTIPTDTTISIYSVWSLMSVKGGFAPNFTYNTGEILWNVSDNDTIFVTNNSSHYPLPPFNDGYYTYSMTSDVIVLNDIFQFEYKLTNDSLIIYYGTIAADGKEFIFVKFNN